VPRAAAPAPRTPTTRPPSSPAAATAPPAPPDASWQRRGLRPDLDRALLQVRARQAGRRALPRGGLGGGGDRPSARGPFAATRVVRAAGGALPAGPGRGRPVQVDRGRRAVRGAARKLSPARALSRLQRRALPAAARRRVRRAGMGGPGAEGLGAR